MADTIRPETIHPENTGPDAAEMFTADRQKFWASFTSFTTAAVVGVVALLVGMAIFLT